MVLDQVIDWRTQDLSDFHAVLVAFVFQYVAEIVRYRANAIEGVVFVIWILAHQVRKEGFECVFHDFSRIADIDIVVVDEFAEACADRAQRSSNRQASQAHGRRSMLHAPGSRMSVRSPKCQR